MLEYAVYLTAQQRMSDLAHEALPGAPVASTLVVQPRAVPRIAARQRLSLALRRLADLIEPAPRAQTPAATGCR